MAATAGTWQAQAGVGDLGAEVEAAKNLGPEARLTPGRVPVGRAAVCVRLDPPTQSTGDPKAEANFQAAQTPAAGTPAPRPGASDVHPPGVTPRQLSGTVLLVTTHGPVQWISRSNLRGRCAHRAGSTAAVRGQWTECTLDAATRCVAGSQGQPWPFHFKFSSLEAGCRVGSLSVISPSE